MNRNLLVVGVTTILLSFVVMSPYSKNLPSQLRNSPQRVRYGFVILVIGVAITAIGVGLPG